MIIIPFIPRTLASGSSEHLKTGISSQNCSSSVAQRLWLSLARATPPSLCTCCFLFSCRMASLRHPLFTWLMPSRFSRFFCCHLLQVLLNFLLHVSSTSTKLCPLLNQYFEFPSAVTLYTLVIVCFLARLSSLQFLSCLLAHKWWMVRARALLGLQPNAVSQAVLNLFSWGSHFSHFGTFVGSLVSKHPRIQNLVPSYGDRKLRT